jgi:hypothetical protein
MSSGAELSRCEELCRRQHPFRKQASLPFLGKCLLSKTTRHDPVGLAFSAVSKGQ